MLTQKRYRVACAVIGKHLPVNGIELDLYIVKIGNIQLGAHLAADLAHDLHSLAVLLIHDYRRAVFDDAGLFVGDLGQRSAENGRMVKADVCNDAAFGAGDDVRCVVSAAEPDLKNDDLAAGIGKPAQCGGGHHLKLRRVIVHRVCMALNLRHDLGKRIILYLPAVYLHALVEAAQIR